jgi:hypothetical protein
VWDSFGPFGRHGFGGRIGGNRLPFASLCFPLLPFVSSSFLLFPFYFPLFPFCFRESSLIKGLRSENRKNEARHKTGFRQPPQNPRVARPSEAPTSRDAPIAHDLPKP